MTDLESKLVQFAKKPGRFERETRKEFSKWVSGGQTDGWIHIPVKLLRREHAWMRRMVNRLGVIYKTSDHYDADNRSSAENLIMDLLTALDKRKR